MRVVAVLAAAFALAAPGVCLAQVTQSYSYDGNGRLTGVVTSNGTNTHTSAYAYDGANNRTARNGAGATTWAAVSRLPANRWLQPDEALISPDGRYSLAFRPSGRLELWSGDAPAPALAGAPSLAAAFRLTDGGEALFLPRPTTASASGDSWVSLGDDGTLLLISETGDEVWRSGNATDQEAGR